MPTTSNRRRLRAWSAGLTGALLLPLACAVSASAVYDQEYVFVGSVPITDWSNGLSLSDDGTLSVGVNHRIEAYDTTGTLPVLETSFLTQGNWSPTGALRQADGTFIAAYFWQGGPISRFGADGAFVETVIPGTGCTSAGATRAFLQDSAGNVLRTDSCSEPSAIETWSQTGDLLRTTTAEDAGRDGATVVDIAITSDDHVYGVWFNTTTWVPIPGVAEIAPDGSVVRTIGAAEAERPRGVATDGLDNIYISTASTVEKFLRDGTHVASIPVSAGGNTGTRPLAVSADGSTVYMLSPNNNMGIVVYRAGTEVLAAPAVSASSSLTSLTATWEPPTNLTGAQVAESYAVRVRVAGGTWSDPVTVAGDVFTHTFTAVGSTAITAATTYEFDVVATDFSGTSDPGTALTTTPSAPVVPDDEPSDPVSSEPLPSDPVSSEPLPSDPVSSEPLPSDPVSSEPLPSDPVSSEPLPSDPTSSKPLPSDPTSSEPVPSDPQPDTSASGDPVPTTPAQTEPGTASPAPTSTDESVQPAPSTPPSPGGLAATGMASVIHVLGIALIVLLLGLGVRRRSA